MQKVVCFKSLFLFQLYSPLDTSPCFFEKNKQTNKQNKNLKTPYPCDGLLMCPELHGDWSLDNIPENFHVFTIFSV